MQRISLGVFSYLPQRASLHVDGEQPVDVVIREAGPDKLDLHPQHLDEEYVLLEHLASLQFNDARTPQSRLLLRNALGLPDCVVLDYTPVPPRLGTRSLSNWR